MDINGVTITFGSLIIIGEFLMVVSNFFGGRKKATKDEEARWVRMETSVSNIEKNTKNQNDRLDKHDEKLEDHEHRITVVETRNNVRRTKH